MGMSPEPTDKSKSLLPRPAVITQAFAAMVREGIRYGYVDTGEVMIFLHINDNDPSIVEYHLCDPSSDVDGDDDKMDFSAVSQLFAFTVQAMKARAASSTWSRAPRRRAT
ncbi:hypothetical protein E4U11_005503 [Claviceps purpurea]|nr:hypothetical protein E4U11_005503 [Claviceps purpurea]